jgi:hypothetical protein
MSPGSQRPREFSEIGRLPAPGNNVAIATQRLDVMLEGYPSLLDGEPARLASLHPEARVPAHPGTPGRLDVGDVA